MAACQYAPKSQGAEEMGSLAQAADCTPEQLFALVVQLYDTKERGAAVAAFEKSTGLAISQ